MAEQERDPRAYELMTVFVPDLTDEDSQAQIEKIEGLVSSNGGTVTETLTASPWGRRRLAYTIRFNGVDYRDGIYTVFHFDMTPSALVDLEREMKLDTNLMRYLLVHDDPKAGEKFRDEDESDEDSAETEEASTTAAASETAGEETATAASEATAPEDDTQPAESEEPSAEAEPELEAVPTETAPAAETTTDTAPPAADEAASDDDKE